MTWCISPDTATEFCRAEAITGRRGYQGDMPSSTFTKHTSGRPARWEVAGLRWLAEPMESGGAAVVEVVSIDDTTLTERRVASTSPSADAATEFGRRLAITHTLDGAARWGEGPPGWEGAGYQGPNEHLLDLSLVGHDSWGAMYADERLMPLLPESGLRANDARVVEQLCERLREGNFDTDDAPARLHGDLWAGNVMWSPEGCVLIDPSAHVGHRETDLAALALFGTPHLDDILDGYQHQYPLADGWRERVPLHYLSMVLMHAVVFGGGYRGQVVDIARRYV